MYERALAGSAVRSRWAVDSRGARVHLVERGSDDSGPPVVLLHGTTACAGFFVPMLAELDGLHVVAADRPGQGLSDPIELPRARFRESAVAWTDRLLDTLELRSTTLVGHSGGALWALWYTLAHPDRVDRLVLFGPPAIPGTRCPVPLRVMARPGIGALLTRLAPPTRKSMLRIAGSMGEKTTLARHPELVDLFVATGRDPVAGRVGREELQALISPVALLTLSGFRRRSGVRAEELRSLEVQTLVVWGEHEPLGSVAVAQAMTDLIPDARLEVLPGGHAPWLGDPARAAAVVTDFVLR